MTSAVGGSAVLRAVWMFAAAMAIAPLSGCAAVPGQSTGTDRAHHAARDGAQRIAASIDKDRLRNTLAADLAYQYSDSSNFGWRHALDGEVAAEAMAWDGMTRDQDGAWFVLRITANVSDDGWARRGGTWTGCFAFRAFEFFEHKNTSADEVACPAGAPSVPPSPLPQPSLPDDVDHKLEEVLAAATKASLASDLKAAFPDGSVRPDAVSGARLTRDSGAEGAVLAVAVGIFGTTDCRVGKRDANGTVHVWHPQNATLQSGEAGCTISNALHPVTTH